MSVQGGLLIGIRNLQQQHSFSTFSLKSSSADSSNAVILLRMHQGLWAIA